MADGSSYSVDMVANASGFESAAVLVTQLAAKLDAAGAASNAAAAALQAGQSKYNELETAASKAAKAVEKAAAAGKDTTDLQAQADAAAAAVKAEAVALDALKLAATSASEEQSKLSDALKSAKASAAESTKELDEGSRALKDLGKKALGPAGEWVEKLSGAMKLFADPATAFAVIAGGVALSLVALTVGAVVGVFALAKLAVELNKVAKVKFDNITKKAQDNFAKLFSGVHVDKFIKSYESITSLLDESSASAKALKEILSLMLNPLFDAVEPLTPIVKELFRGMVIGALLLAIAVVTAKNAISKLIPDGILSNIDWLNVALNAGVIAMFALAAAVGIAALAFAALVAVGALGLFMVFSLPIAIIAAIAIIGLLAYALYGLGSKAFSAGGQIIQGLLNSIESGSGMVFAALSKLGSGAIGALKSALGIASPSKYAIAFGSNVTSTFAQTVEDGAPDVHSAMESIVEPPDASGFSPAQSGSTSRQSNSKSFAFTGNTFVFNGVQGAEDAESRFESLLTRIIEGDVTTLGGEVPA